MSVYLRVAEGSGISWSSQNLVDGCGEDCKHFVYECGILLYLPADHPISLQAPGYLLSAADYGESSVVSAGTDVLYLHDLPCFSMGAVWLYDKARRQNYYGKNGSSIC